MLPLLADCRLVLFVRRKLEEWTCDGETRELKLEAKPGEELYLEQLIRFCYSRQVTLTEGHPLTRS
jgi:hypothetical protein